MNPYRELGVSPDANAEEIQRAYRQRAKETHPDATGGDTEAFQRVNEANIILSDPVKRAQYDSNNPIDAIVWAAFEKAMMQAAGQYQYVNLIDLTKRFLRDSIAEGKRANTQLATVTADMRKMLDRVNGAPAIRATMEQRIAAAERSAIENEQKIADVQEAIDSLDGATWTVDDDVRTSYYSGPAWVVTS